MSDKRKYLQEVSDVSIGPFGVRPWNFKQGAFLTNYKNVHNLSNVVAMSCSYDQEIGLGHLVKVDWGTEEVVLKCLKKATPSYSFPFYTFIGLNNDYFPDVVAT